MKHQVWLFTSSMVWTYDGEPTNAIIECWGAGGHGSKYGNGGSGGAYAAKKFVLVPGKYEIFVGQGTFGDGQQSYFESVDGIVAKAAGGKCDGSIVSQKEASIGTIIFEGGMGGRGSSGNGGGGGGCAGMDGIGAKGQDGEQSTLHTPAKGGRYNNSGVEAFGGAGAYYYAGAGINKLYPAAQGGFPGCGGGGNYNQQNGADLSAPGGSGCVAVWYYTD